MGKSTFPKRYEASLKASAATNKTVDQDVKTFKSLAKALKDAGTMSANMPRDYNGTYARQQEQSVIYGKAVAMILELEDKLAEAEKSKDKTAQKDLQKKIKAQEKICETCVKTLNDLRKVYSQLRAMLEAQLAAADAEFAKLNTVL